MLMSLQLKLARSSNWLTSLSHVSPVALIDPLWTMAVFIVTFAHLIETLHAPLKHSATAELRQLLSQVVSGDANTLMLGDIGSVLWKLAGAFVRAYVEGITKSWRRIAVAVVTFLKLVELVGKAVG